MSKCIRIVGELKYDRCSSNCVKHGMIKNIQRYKCKKCSQTFMGVYKNKACNSGINKCIVNFVKEGCGIRSIGRLLNISTTRVLKRILEIAKNITKPPVAINKSYEVDELCTYYKNKSKLLLIVYALEKNTGTIADFAVGSRTKMTLQNVTSTLLLSDAGKIYTDKLNLYGFIIPRVIHCTGRYSTNHIERKNLSLRIHFKRLNRRTICFTKNIAMLIACLKIYFWSKNNYKEWS